MTLMAQAQHFAGPPHWTWFIVPYFFLAGLAGGCYARATLLRFRGERWGEPAARLGFYAAFGAFLPCPVLLTLDLTPPLRFWHMLWNTTPGAQGFNFKYWSPMSLGSWALVVFGLFATVTFVEVLVRDGALRRPLAVRAVRPLDEAFGFPWILLWLVAFAGLVPGLRGLLTARLAVTAEGTVVAQPALAAATMPGLVLLGVLALRAAVILSAQF